DDVGQRLIDELELRGLLERRLDLGFGLVGPGTGFLAERMRRESGQKRTTNQRGPESSGHGPSPSLSSGFTKRARRGPPALPRSAGGHATVRLSSPGSGSKNIVRLSRGVV